MIGILPNQLRAMLKQENPDNCDIAFEDISRELFWQGYTIWQARKARIKEFWNIAPNWWKLHYKEKKSGKKLREAEIAKQCKSPFHFQRRNKNLSGQRPTICACSHVWHASFRHKFRDIRTFFIKDNLNNTFPRERKVSSSYSTKKRSSYEAREDLIRGAHDRGKCARINII